VGDAPPLSKKVGGRRPPASQPHYTPACVLVMSACHFVTLPRQTTWSPRAEKRVTRLICFQERHSDMLTLTTKQKLEGKYSLESTDPAKAKFAPTCVRNSLLSYYVFIIAKLFKVKVGCLKFVYIGRNRRFTVFLDSKIHTRLAIVTGNELGLAFPPRNLPKKFRPDPSTFYLVIVATDRQTDRQTYAGENIIPRESFRGDNYRHASVQVSWP